MLDQQLHHTQQIYKFLYNIKLIMYLLYFGDDRLQDLIQLYQVADQTLYRSISILISLLQWK